jgi:RNA polymerase sigma factor (sigma-70 family)
MNFEVWDILFIIRNPLFSIHKCFCGILCYCLNCNKIILNNIPQVEETIDHLFRQEWGKLVTVLTKLFGPQNLQLAEDVVQDTLMKAQNNWKINGLPQNPSAWLFTAARNKTIDVLRAQKRNQEFSKSLMPLLQSDYTLEPTVNEILTTNSLNDDLLRMMFVCCHPSLSTEAQVSLILKTLCGFSVAEIARAFISNYDTIEKRLYRARQSFRDNKVSFALPVGDELDNRLQNVLVAIYLLFNEGYNTTQHEKLIRSDLMKEAMRLCELLCNTVLIKQEQAHALMALMCFTSSRNEARLDETGNILLLKQQDRLKWNKQLIEKGVQYLEASADGQTISKYHLEAGIAYQHALAVDYAHTNWKAILEYYNLLQRYYPSPVIELNRAIVINELNGPEAALRAIETISHAAVLKNYYLLAATLGELYWQLGKYEIAKTYFKEAITLTQSGIEKKLLQQKINR